MEAREVIERGRIPRVLDRAVGMAATRVLPSFLFLTLAFARRDAIASSIQRLSDPPGFAEALGAGLVLLHVLLGATFYVLVAWLFLRRSRARMRSRGFGPSLVAFAGAWAAAPFGLLPLRTDSIELLIVGNALMVFGLGSSLYALWTLGNSFGIRASARQLVTDGPYGYVRHPLYVAETITVLGMVVLTYSPAAVATLIAFVLLQYRRALIEEQVLAAAFPTYVEYRARTARFIPGLI